MHRPKHEEVCEVYNVPDEIVYVDDIRYWYPAGPQASNSDGSAKSIHYKLSPDRLVQKGENKAFKGKDKEIRKKIGSGRTATRQDPAAPSGLLITYFKVFQTGCFCFKDCCLFNLFGSKTCTANFKRLHSDSMGSGTSINHSVGIKN